MFLLKMPELVYYCMTKSALDMFTKCLALELAPQGVRVNSIKYVEVWSTVILIIKIKIKIFIYFDFWCNISKWINLIFETWIKNQNESVKFWLNQNNGTSYCSRPCIFWILTGWTSLVRFLNFDVTLNLLISTKLYFCCCR